MAHPEPVEKLITTDSRDGARFAWRTILLAGTKLREEEWSANWPLTFARIDGRLFPTTNTKALNTIGGNRETKSGNDEREIAVKR